jgi:hypothetical protein
MEGRTTLYILGVCGLASVLVDLDHAVSLIWWRFFDSTLTEGRICHAPLFTLASLAFCGMVPFTRGLYNKLVLIGAIVVTILLLIYSPYVFWGIRR